MHPRFTVRRFLVFIGVGAIAIAAPFAVLAATGTFNGAAERQSARWVTAAVSTSSKTWRNVPGLVITRCTLNQVTLMLSVNVEGGPVRFRAIIDDVPEAPMKPTSSRFVPQGADSFAYTFVGRTGPFEADDTHRFNVQWRSPTGAQVTMHQGAINLLFKRRTQGCP
jgi:hypothetical protein